MRASVCIYLFMCVYTQTSYVYIPIRILIYMWLYMALSSILDKAR